MLPVNFILKVIIALFILVLILGGSSLLADEICYRTDEGELRCSFDFWGYSEPPIVHAIECAYYNCVLGSYSDDKIKNIGSWEYNGKKITCMDIYKEYPVCGEEDAFGITIEDNSRNEVTRKAWQRIVKNSGEKNYKEIAHIVKPSLSGDCRSYSTIVEYGILPSVKIRTNVALVVFPKGEKDGVEYSNCKHSIWTSLKKIFTSDVGSKSCRLSAGNYKIWVERENTNDNYDVIICPESKVSESLGDDSSSGGGF